MRVRRHHVAAAAVVVMAHAAVVQLFTRVGAEGAAVETPYLEASLIDGPGYSAASPSPPSPAAKASPALAAAPPPEAMAETAAEKPITDPVSPLGEVSFTDRPIDIGPPSATTQTANLVPAPGGVVCRITEDLQAALQADAAVRQAVMRIPVSQRSVANAVKVWDEDWVADGPAERQDWAWLHPAVTSILESAPAACLDEVLAGPRLILVGDAAEGATLLAFGSGEWQWRSVADDLPKPTLANVFTRLFGFR